MGRVLALDLGGVVLRINHTWQEAAATAGVTLGRPENGGGLNDFAPIHAFQKEDIDYQVYTDALASFLGVSIEDARKVHEGILIGPYAGSSELVDCAKAAGIMVGVLSNTNRPHIEYCLAEFPVCVAVDFFGTSYDAGANKPEPEIFQWFADKVYASPDEIAFFDDSQVNVDAAAQSGWRAYAVDPKGDPPSSISRVLADMGWL